MEDGRRLSAQEMMDRSKSSRSANQSLVFTEVENFSELNASVVQDRFRESILKKKSGKFRLLVTISDYIYNDIRKRKRSFCIGTITVFLVVCFLTTLKSIIDIAPIAFLKVGQDQAGSIDFTLNPREGSLSQGDCNVY